MWIDEKAPEREERVAALLAEKRPIEWPTVVVPPTLDGCHPVIGRTAKRLGNSTRTKILEASGHDVLSVAVSPAQKDRALRIIGGIFKTATAAGARVMTGTTEGRPVHLEVVSEFVSFRIEEQFDRTWDRCRAPQSAAAGTTC